MTRSGRASPWPTATRGGDVDLDSSTGSDITLERLRVTGSSNARVTSIEVIRTTTGNGIGFYPSDLTAGMQAGFSSAQRLRGFRLPAHSRGIYEAVFLLTAIDPSRDATTKNVVVTYSDDGSSWSDTRHSSFCLAVHPSRGCAA